VSATRSHTRIDVLAEREERWLRIGLSTRPIDRARALAAIGEAYTCAGLVPPATVAWVQSPFVGACTNHLWREMASSVEKLMHVRSAGEELAHLHRWSPAGDPARDKIVEPPLTVRPALGPQFAPSLRAVKRIRSLVVDELYQWLEEPRVGARGSLDAAAFARLEEDAARRQPSAVGLLATGRECGFWWPYERGVIIADRPELIALDDAGLPHSEEGMAIRYRDGWGVYAWHGVPVPKAIALAPDRLSVVQIDAEEDEQVRRVCIDRMGLDRYMKDSGARLLDEQFVNERSVKLWRRDHPGHEPLVAVEIVNASPEPDGHHRRHWLRVPPQMRRARSALAWTFGLGARAYNPAVET